jgi:hypothetical protein
MNLRKANLEQRKKRRALKKWKRKMLRRKLKVANVS